MTNMADVSRLAENFTLGSILSEYGNNTYDEIIEALDDGYIPDGVLAWYPFQDFSPEELLDAIEDLRNQFLMFYKQTKEV